MRNDFLCLVVISVLLLAAGIVRIVHRGNVAANRQGGSNSIAISVFTVLQAHGGYNDKEQPRFTQTATLTYYTDSRATPQSMFERKIRLSTDHSLVRFDKTTLNGDQSFLSNGQALVRTTSQAEIQLEVRILEDFESAGIKFQIATFGLLPILKRLSDSSTQVNYVGATSKGNQFHVKTANGSWYFYTNSKHQIARLEVDDINITYGDYRTVEGLRLPFYQQVKKGNRLLYEIRFDAFDLNPVFADGFFKSKLL